VDPLCGPRVSKYLIGKGFLEPSNFVVLIGASYAGKSTLTAQLSVLWAIGKPTFGIEIPRPLRTIFFQAEDSENKLISIGHLCRRLNLSPNQRNQVKENTAVVTLYMGAGMASITNACRGTLLLLPVDGDVFALCGGNGF
jgi:RecA-family ATPase